MTRALTLSGPSVEVVVTAPHSRGLVINHALLAEVLLRKGVLPSRPSRNARWLTRVGFGQIVARKGRDVLERCVFPLSEVSR